MRILLFEVAKTSLLLVVIFIQTCTSYHSHYNTKKISTTKCYDHHLLTAAVDVSGLICRNVDVNWSQYAFQGAVAGGCRALSRGLTFPFDTLKTLEQTSKSDKKNMSPLDSVESAGAESAESDNLSKLKKLISKDYFRGIIPAVASAVPANAVFFVVYNYLQTIAASECVLQALSIEDTSFYQKTSILFIERLIFSAVATLPQNAIKIPAELIKQRAQVQPKADIFLLIKDAIKPPNGLKGLYQGGGAQLIREIPYNAIQMATFQFFKDTLLVNTEVDGSYLGFSKAGVSAVLGLVAAAIAALLTQPADVIKTRLMTKIESDDNYKQLDYDNNKNSNLNKNIDNHNDDKDKSDNMIDNYSNNSNISNKKKSKKDNIGIIKTTQQILDEQGYRGLFVGLTPRLILVSLGGMVYFWAAEIASEMFEMSLAK